MKRLLSGFVLVALAALLSGCYYNPGYSYVRATPYAGAAYYGNGVVYGNGYGYYAAPAWYDGWYGPRYYVVYNDTNYWNWTGETPVRLALTFQRNGKTFRDQFEFRRVKMK